MEVPSVGGARGVFEIFVPGVFLFLNLVGGAYLVPGIKHDLGEVFAACKDSVLITTLIVATFGYLVGVVLRLVKPTWLDTVSGSWNWRTAKGYRFPFISYVGRVCEHLPADAQDFFEKHWRHHDGDNYGKNFLNYCKVLINIVDERSSKELQANESMVRYIAGMFYALVVSVPWVFVCAVVSRLMGSQAHLLGLGVLLAAYVVAGLVIVRNFRFIRVKEVEAVFVAHYANAKRISNLSRFGSETAASEHELDIVV